MNKKIRNLKKKNLNNVLINYFRIKSFGVIN